MRKQLLVSGLVAVALGGSFVALLLNGCEERKSLASAPNQESEEHFSLTFPPGTAFNQSDSGIDFKLPEGFFLRISEKGSFNTLFVNGSGSVKCTCSSGTGQCWPSKINNTVSCNTDITKPCKKCEMTVTVDASPFPVHEYDFSIEFGDADDASMLQTPSDEMGKAMMAISLAYASESAVYPINSYTRMTKMPWVTPEILERPNVKSILTEIEESYIQDANALPADGVIPSGYRLCPFSIENHLGLVLLPEALVQADDIPFLPLAAGTAYSCSGCRGSCVLKSKGVLKYKVYYCDGCDSDCELSWID